MKFSSPLVATLFEITLARLVAAETSAAAFSSIKYGGEANSIAKVLLNNALSKSRTRFERYSKLLESHPASAEPTFDVKLNRILDRVFSPKNGSEKEQSMPEHIFDGIMEIRRYQEKLLVEFRAVLVDHLDQEARHWASEELIRLRSELIALEGGSIGAAVVDRGAIGTSAIAV